MNLAEWARQQGIHPHTAYRWFRNGTLPVEAERVGPRTILVKTETGASAPSSGVGLYARVSSHDQKADLDRQVARLSVWAAKEGHSVTQVQAEVASGMNGQRKKLQSLLSDASIEAIIVEHRDRFGRMNTGLVEAALAASNRRLIVIDNTEMDDDLVRDMTEVLTSFCARLYGRRSARHRASRALEHARKDAAA